MKSWFVGLFACALVLGSAPVSSSPVDPCPAQLLPRPPVLIQGDDDFGLPTSGVVAGSGTPDDPYVICGWDIVPLARDGIRLEDTSAHVVIRNNLVHNALVELKVLKYDGDPINHFITGGINLHNAANVRVEDNVIVNNSAIVGASVVYPPSDGFVLFGIDGIVVEFSDHITLAGNKVSRNAAYGMRLRESQQVLVEDNDIARNNREGSFGGLTAWAVSDLTVQDNRVNANPAVSAVHFGNSPGAILRENVIDNPSTYGVGISISSHGARVEDNLISGSIAGITSSNSAGVVATRNDLGGNLETGVKSWTHLVNAEDNWWGCPEGPGNPGCVAASTLVDFDPWATTPFFP